ncbi:hypothetical protein FOA52_013837 [Chlamydomonas sp. UWO 241]|nr:hypothetical protein FOA52_013837 [Chlamydomonas sp. UWO 241]
MQEAVRGSIAMASGGKYYRLRTDGKVATMLVRPRGWHMEERHLTVDGQASVDAGFGPYFYLPKMESHLEARLWNDVFNMAQAILIETLLAAFEMDEILYELRDHSSGLNCGRWDYIFSFIKKLRAHPQYVLPERSCVGMTSPFMDAYVRLLIKTCHARGVHAMGGMAAQIPIKNDAAKNQAALAKVRIDKQREVEAGHDGTWVAHPDLVTVALEVFNKHMPQPNQLYRRREEVHVTAADLLNVSGLSGGVTEAGVRENIDIGLQYMEAWLRGVGCVPIHNLMEDAATAEISRSMLYQWVRHGARTTDGQVVTVKWVEALMAEDLSRKRATLGEERFARSKYPLAARLFAGTTLGGGYADFLTTLCYEHIVTPEGKAKM